MRAVIGRDQVTTEFFAYVASYDLTSPKFQLKVDHSLRVASLSDRIADSLGMQGQAKELAWLLGMLHDIGRFEQLRRYGTFRDGLSVDHAALGADLLFKEGLLQRFITADAAAQEYQILEKAIRLHNAYLLPEDLTDTEYRYVTLLRDADKVDILRVNIETPRQAIYDVPDKVFLEAAITPSVYENILQCRNLDRQTMKTPMDLILGHISFLFGLVYKESVRQVEEQGYLATLLQLESHNPTTREQFVKIREVVAAYIAQRLGES